MKLFRSSNPVAAAGVVGALALGTVVSVGALAPAGAVTATPTYSCDLLGTGLELPIATTADLPTQLTAGETVAPIDAEMQVPLPEPVVTMLKAFGLSSIGGSVTDAAFALGPQRVLGTFTAAETGLPPTGGVTLPAKGALQGFTAPQAGTYDLIMPKSFEFMPATLPTAIPCTYKSGPTSLGEIQVLQGSEPDEKQASDTTARIKNAPVTVGERGRLRVRVTDEDGPGAGKVVVRLDGERRARKTLNDRGRVGLRLPKLGRGKHVLVVKYLGNAETERSRDRIRFRVRRG